MTRSAILLSALLVCVAAVPAQLSSTGIQQLMLGRDSGAIQNPTAQTSIGWSDLVSIPGASSIQLHFQDVVLAHEDDRLLITGIQDGETQALDAVALKYWQNHTAWFNGQAVTIL